MNDIEKISTILNISTPVVWFFLFMSAVISGKKIIEEFSKIIGKPVKWLRAQEEEKKRLVTLEKEYDALKGSFDVAKEEMTAAVKEIREENKEMLAALKEETQKTLDAMREVDLVTCWKDIISMGMEAIAAGHITYSNKALINKTYKAYHGVNGNGHVTEFMLVVNSLPFTEELTDEQMAALAPAAGTRIKKAQLALANYYILNGRE